MQVNKMDFLLNDVTQAKALNAGGTGSNQYMFTGLLDALLINLGMEQPLNPVGMTWQQGQSNPHAEPPGNPDAGEAGYDAEAESYVMQNIMPTVVAQLYIPVQENSPGAGGNIATDTDTAETPAAPRTTVEPGPKTLVSLQQQTVKPETNQPVQRVPDAENLPAAGYDDEAKANSRLQTHNATVNTYGNQGMVSDNKTIQTMPEQRVQNEPVLNQAGSGKGNNEGTGNDSSSFDRQIQPAINNLRSTPAAGEKFTVAQAVGDTGNTAGETANVQQNTVGVITNNATVNNPAGFPVTRAADPPVSQQVFNILHRNIIQSNEQSSEIKFRLKPEHLGEVTVRLSIVKGALTAMFYTSGEVARNALENALPQLRESLAQYNLKLDEASVYVGQDEGRRGEQREREYRYNTNYNSAAHVPKLEGSVSSNEPLENNAVTGQLDYHV